MQYVRVVSISIPWVSCRIGRRRAWSLSESCRTLSASSEPAWFPPHCRRRWTDTTPGYP